MSLTFAQLEGLWIQAGGDAASAPIAAAVALAESSGNPQATNPTDNHGRQTSWGLWQISNGTHSEPVANILDPLVNAQQAVGKYKAAGNTFARDWGTYISGAYKRFLQSGIPPDTSGVVLTDDKTNNNSNNDGGISGLIQSVTDVFKPVGDLFTALAWIVNPINWLRILLGFIGAGMSITGFIFIGRAV